MAHTETFGPVGIALPAGSGTGVNDHRMLLNQYAEAYVISTYLVVGASQGPIWGTCVLRTANNTVVMAPSAWISGDANFGGVDTWYFQGKLGISAQGGNEIIPLVRNDTGAAATVQVGGSVLIVRD